MNEPPRTFDAQDAQDLLTTMNTLLMPLLAGEGAAVFVDPQHLAQVREVFYAARSSREHVIARHKGLFTEPRVLSAEEWIHQAKALNALGVLLRSLDQDIPGGIPDEDLDTEGEPPALAYLRSVMDETQEVRREVYHRTIGSFTTHEIGDKELLAFERVTHAVNLLLGRPGPNA